MVVRTKRNWDDLALAVSFIGDVLSESVLRFFRMLVFLHFLCYCDYSVVDCAVFCQEIPVPTNSVF